MKPSSTSRVSRQAAVAPPAPLNPSEHLTSPFSSSVCLEDDDVGRVLSNGRMQYPHPYPCPYPAAAKAWASDAVPPSGENSSADLHPPATATFHYYRQRRDLQGEGGGSALMSWLAALLCMPRFGSGRPWSGAATRADSVDSVDFVSTWQRAQAARRVVPVLKRSNDITLPPAPSALGPPSSRPESPPPLPFAVRGAGSTHGSVTVPLGESSVRNRTTSLPGVAATGAATDGGGAGGSIRGAERPSSCPPSLHPLVRPSGTFSAGDLIELLSDEAGPTGGDQGVFAYGSRACSPPDSRQNGRRSVRFG